MPDKLLAYGRQCYAILQSSNAEITHKLGFQSSQPQETLAVLFDGLAKTAQLPLKQRLLWSRTWSIWPSMYLGLSKM